MALPCSQRALASPQGSNCMVVLSDYPIRLLDGPTMLTEGPNRLSDDPIRLSEFSNGPYISESQMISYHDHALRLSEGHMKAYDALK